jgi:hypothetical protein
MGMLGRENFKIDFNLELKVFGFLPVEFQSM